MIPRHGPYQWSVVVFARNEAARILGSLRAVEDALRGRNAFVTVLINGSSDKTASLVKTYLPGMSVSNAAYSIAYGCKSNAINQFVHALRPKADYYLFVDATVSIGADVPALFQQTFEADASIEAVSGLPKNGRGAEAMRKLAERAPRLFGQMFAIRGSVIENFVARNRRLPVGLYRGDGLLSGFMVHETNGVAHSDPAPRLATVSEAQWGVKSLSPFDISDIRAAFNRRVRQSRGRLENLAWNSIIWDQGFGALPANADDMILEWLSQHDLPAVGLTERIFRSIALQRIRNSRRPDEASLTPRQLDP